MINVKIPGWTAEMSLEKTNMIFHEIAAEEFRGVLQSYLNGLHNAIQPSRISSGSGPYDVCDVCERNGKSCCYDRFSGFYCC
jgi:hypothetical protein